MYVHQFVDVRNDVKILDSYYYNTIKHIRTSSLLVTRFTIPLGGPVLRDNFFSSETFHGEDNLVEVNSAQI